MITSLVEYRNRDTIEALTEMLRLAHEGKVRGVVFTAWAGRRRHALGVTGDYWHDPAQALAAANRMAYLLNQYITEADTGQPPPSAHGKLGA